MGLLPFWDAYNMLQQEMMGVKFGSEHGPKKGAIPKSIYIYCDDVGVRNLGILFRNGRFMHV